MINLISAFAFATFGVVFINRYESHRKMMDLNLIMAVWTILLAGMNLEKFLRGLTMNTNCEEWCRIECGECKWFKVNADMDGVESTCKRLDHKHLRFAKKIFKSYDCGCFDINTCADFEPDEKKVPWLYNHWNEVKGQIIPYGDNNVVLLNVDGDTSIRWAVKAIEFYDGTFLNPDGSLRWVYKYYSVPCRTSPSKYKTLYEFS